MTKHRANTFIRRYLFFAPRDGAGAGKEKQARTHQGLVGWLAGAVPSNLNSVLNEILAAEKARDIVGVSVKRDPERLRDDDGFKRHD
jgi:hypothetical protein